MNKSICKSLCIILSILMLCSVMVLPSYRSNAEGSTIDDFVERCYTVTLDRPSEPEGFADWKDQLLNGKAVGVYVAYGFLFSPEYTAKDKSPEDYVTDLYMLFMGREPDEDGFNDWVGQLETGKSRVDVFAGFANSQEFYNICDEYGITAGRWVNGYDRNQVNNVNLFVERFYKICLGRRGDIEGQKNWVERLLNKQISGVDCAWNFINSQEYRSLELSDEEYVENLYIALMGRPSDAEGKEHWLNSIAAGKKRNEVFEGFANSKEFGEICSTYKINKGSFRASAWSDYSYEVVLDKEMLEMINSYRAENGLDALEWDSEQEAVAIKRIKDIANGGELSHSAAGGPPEGYVAENLFRGSGGLSSQFIFDCYKSSPGHDINMRNTSATSCVIVTYYIYKEIGELKVNSGEWNIQIFF